MKEVTHNARLQNVSCSTGSKAGLHKIGVGMNRQKNDLCTAPRYAQLLAGVYPAENRHGNVRDDEIGLKALRGIDQGLAVRHTPNYFTGWFQQTLHHVQER